MRNALQITFRDMSPSDALEARIRDQAAKLEKFHSNITSCRVTVEESRKHHSQGRHFGVRIEVHVPGGEPLMATLKHDEDVYVAVRDAFGAVRRQLEEGLREMRGEVKAHEAPLDGKMAR
jgi:ribosomal subunit interface protein